MLLLAIFHLTIHCFNINRLRSTLMSRILLFKTTVLIGQKKKEAVSQNTENDTATTLTNQSSYCCGLDFP